MSLLLFLPGSLLAADICGTVRSGEGQPLSGAIVRVKGTAQSVATDSEGRFCLSIPKSIRGSTRVVAWMDGFNIAGIDARDGVPVELTLHRWVAADHAGYAWLPPRVERGAVRDFAVARILDLANRLPFAKLKAAVHSRLTTGCRDCHRQCHDEWEASGHALGARNERFMSMYLGTHVDGRAGQRTAFAFSRDYGWRPLPSDPTKPHFGPGYKLDFPLTAGNCAACHLPGAAIDAPFNTSADDVAGIDSTGIHCDFCHKIRGVILDSERGRPKSGMPGVLSLTFARPMPDSQLFLGSLDDVDAGSDSFLSLMKQSEICAPCHDATFWGTPVYESFGEWKESVYARRGVTCQDCHMKPTGSMNNFAPRRGGIERNPRTLASHDFAGIRNAALMRDSVRLAVATSVDPSGGLTVEVTVTNATAGHHIPTDSPLRHLILIVRATSGSRPLPLTQGSTIPQWCGVGEAGDGNYAGLPGKAFAKLLLDVASGTVPTAAYWNRTRIVSDNRIPAMGSDTSSYRFDGRGIAAIDLRVDLIYRPAFKELVAQKGWTAPDLLLATETKIVRGAHDSLSVSQRGVDVDARLQTAPVKSGPTAAKEIQP